MQPDTKTQKYDRQLRLWQAHGQAKLENAKVCLINGTATGSEILKNLVLPGIGSFTIVDEATVKESDLGNNFFVSADYLGSSRAKCVTELLIEMNEDVRGSHVEEDVSSLLSNKSDFFLGFTLVIATQVHEKDLIRLSNLLWTANIPLVVVRTFGFIGYMRISVPEHQIIETHPDQQVDLRLDQPFLSLQEFYKKFDFPSMDSRTKSHTPYVVILLQVLAHFKSQHQGKLPSTKEEKAAFKQLIRDLMGDHIEEPENFEEALNAAFKAFQLTKISSDSLALLNDSLYQNLTPDSDSFYIMLKAVANFINNEGNGLPPVVGTLPDMKSDTASFVSLQRIYREKARQDSKVVYDNVQSILASLDKPSDTISLIEVERFCKNFQNLKVLKYKSVKDEYESLDGKKLTKLIEEDLDSNIVYYILLRVIDRFYETHRRYPGLHNSDIDQDISLMKKVSTSLLTKWGMSANCIPDDLIHEIVRTGGCEIHTMAALQGGIVSQEVIKLITSQYVPLFETFIFNGMKSTSSSFRL